MLDACIKTGCATPGVVWMDGCDYGELRLPEGWKAVACEEHLNIGEIMRRFYAENPNLPWYGWMSDDCAPVSAGWDKELIKQAGRYCIAYPDDGWQQGKNGAGNPHVTSLICFGGDLPREMGFWVRPQQIQMYIDDLWESVAIPAGLMRYCPHVKALHKHFANGLRTADKTDTRTFNGIHFPTHDRDVYQSWVKSDEYRDCLRRVLRKTETELLNVVCLKAGAAYSADYVNILYDMVRRNLGKPFRFHCITDDPAGLDPAIRVIELPADLEKWWGKLYMFKRGLFADRARLLFMDLDTVVIGSLDELSDYRGQFATLRDFYYPERLGPAIIMWEAGDFSASIWDEWVAEGKPRHAMGDLWWLNRLDQGRFARRVDILQEKFKGTFCSFKVSCRPNPPEGVKVVCFHGQPKPDNCGVEWVKQAWSREFHRIEFVTDLNTPMETMIRQAEENLSRDLPMFMECPANLNEALIVGGGPSLQHNLPNIRMRRDRGGIIFALNGTHDWLIDRGIVPDFHVMLDARRENVQFVRRPHKDVTYLTAAQCHPDVFNALKGYKVIVWLGCFDTREQENDLAKKFPNKPIMLVGGGATVGLKTMNLAYLAGFRKLHFYGFDSCYSGESNHAYPQPLNDKESRIEVIAAWKKFTCAPWMAKQAMEFQSQMRQLLDAGCQIYVHGDGLIPWIVQQHQGGDR